MASFKLLHTRAELKGHFPFSLTPNFSWVSRPAWLFNRFNGFANVPELVRASLDARLHIAANAIMNMPSPLFSLSFRSPGASPAPLKALLRPRTTHRPNVPSQLKNAPCGRLRKVTEGYGRFFLIPAPHPLNNLPDNPPPPLARHSGRLPSAAARFATDAHRRDFVPHRNNL